MSAIDHACHGRPRMDGVSGLKAPRRERRQPRAVAAKRFAALVCLLLLPGLFLACGRSTVHYTDNDDVLVEEITHFKEGEFLVLQATLRNDSSSAVETPVYRVEWFNGEGRLLETTAWRPLIVKGGASQHIRERSTVPGAVEYTLILSTDAR